MKIERSSRLLWFIFFVWVILLVNSVFAQEGNRKYVYKDYNSADTVFSHPSVSQTYTIMPDKAVENGMVGFDASKGKGFDGSGTTIKIEFTKLEMPPKWAGIVISVEKGYWGEEKEKPITSVLDLSHSKRLVFYARGEKGGEQIQVKAAIAGDKPYGDSALVPVTSKWITLDKEWKLYDVKIENPGQLTRVITPFAVIASFPYNPGGAITIYLDEIYYE